MNENYLLFLASLIEYHFNDVQALINYSKTMTVSKADFANTDTSKTDNSQAKCAAIDETLLASLSKTSPFIKSIIATENSLKDSDDDKAQILQFVKISIDSIAFEWVFDLGFDDHEENFVTLNNRNFSKLILDQFDRKR